MIIGLLILGSILIIVNWLPGVSDAWDAHNPEVRSVYFTVVFFIIWISRLWSWRRRNTLLFWAFLGVVFLLHVFTVLVYSARIHSLSIRDWLILATAESAVIVFCLDSLTKRFSKLGYGDRKAAGKQIP
jgi:hypothetical protein